jgi:hypothetical protein
MHSNPFVPFVNPSSRSCCAVFSAFARPPRSLTSGMASARRLRRQDSSSSALLYAAFIFNKSYVVVSVEKNEAGLTGGPSNPWITTLLLGGQCWIQSLSCEAKFKFYEYGPKRIARTLEAEDLSAGTKRLVSQFRPGEMTEGEKEKATFLGPLQIAALSKVLTLGREQLLLSFSRKRPILR